MSTIYVLEPPTKGKVVLNTSYGPIDIELWPKEAPKAVRNFVQLCLEGYYNHTVFHRVIKQFLVQGGDPTATGEGGESIYGSPFPDEFHSRLRFKHRGLVACAGAGTPNSNGSQFFITLDQTDYLDKKHTIFGKVTGDSIFNLLQLGEVDTDAEDRPLEPLPEVISVEVLWNPFDDIVPRALPARPLRSPERKEPKQKVTKKLNLLSFGEEAEEEEKVLAAVSTRIKSSHDVLNDPRLLKENGQRNDMSSAEVQRTKDAQLNVREALSTKSDRRKGSVSVSESLDHSDEDEASFDARMRQQILKKKQELGDSTTKHKLPNERLVSGKRAASPPRSDVEDQEEKQKVDKLSLKKKGIGSEARADRLAKADSDLQLLKEAERERLLQKQKRRRRQGHEEDVLAKLEKFKSALSSKSKGSDGEGAVGKDEDASDWMRVSLKFAPESGKEKMSRSNDVNDYVVHDPLLEKGKEKFNKMQAKEKRKQREWAGKSLA